MILSAGYPPGLGCLSHRGCTLWGPESYIVAGLLYAACVRELRYTVYGARCRSKITDLSRALYKVCETRQSYQLPRRANRLLSLTFSRASGGTDRHHVHAQHAQPKGATRVHGRQRQVDRACEQVGKKEDAQQVAIQRAQEVWGRTRTDEARCEANAQHQESLWRAGTTAGLAGVQLGSGAGAPARRPTASRPGCTAVATPAAPSHRR